MDRLTHISRRLTDNPAFELGIVAIIIINALLLGLGTSPTLDRDYGDWIGIGYQIALAIFIAEALLKMTASSPRVAGYFKDGWNVFDFLIIVFALIPATGQFAMIARLARLLRVLRLVSTIRDLRLIVAALVRSIPSVGHVIMLMSIMVYIYAIIGYHLFSEARPRELAEPRHFRFDAVQHHHAGRVDRGHVHRHGASPAGVDLLRQLRSGRDLRSDKPLHRHHHKQPG